LHRIIPKTPCDFFCLPIFLFTLFSTNSFEQTYTGPVPKPASGYGSDGSYSVITQTLPNASFPSHDIVIYNPDGITTPVPTLFYSHAFGGNNPANISGFLNFVAQKGYAVVFVPYPIAGTVDEHYTTLREGFVSAARTYPNIIDTAKVGFVGHSFGGGATFANAYYCFTQLNRGQSGRFILALAQWYAYNITQTELQSFPSDVKILTIVFEDDETNDLRMANDIFNTINIPASEKDYLRVQTDTISGYIYLADHIVPNNSRFDALDYYAYYRLLDALCDYVFHGNLSGKDVALGGGSSAQINMPGGMRPLIHSETPDFVKAQSNYEYPCTSASNPRIDHCDETPSVPGTPDNPVPILYPNPAQTMLHIESNQPIDEVRIFNTKGQILKIVRDTAIPVQELPAGLYFIKIKFSDKSQSVKRFIKG
jgi:hypothetical protein